LSVNVDKNLPDIYMKVSNIQQVFLNIIGNALDALKSSDEKSLSIRMYANEKCINVDIEDTGCGIDHDHILKIFDPFFTTKPPGKGTGLGLSVSNSIIKAHEGTINVFSEKGKGSLFKICLPLNNKKKISIILVVDDDIMIHTPINQYVPFFH